MWLFCQITLSTCLVLSSNLISITFYIVYHCFIFTLTTRMAHRATTSIYITQQSNIWFFALPGQHQSRWIWSRLALSLQISCCVTCVRWETRNLTKFCVFWGPLRYQHVRVKFCKWEWSFWMLFHAKLLIVYPVSPVMWETTNVVRFLSQVLKHLCVSL